VTRAEWRVLVADDEPAARRGVRQLLAAFPQFRIVGECRDGAEALASLDTLEPDVVFLDIQMPGIDGFELIRQRTLERMPAVVFLTAFDQFAIRAFEAQALDYLLKPVSEARFAATIKRLLRQLPIAASARDPGIVVATGRGISVLRPDEIDWIEASDNYVRIWAGARSYLHRESMNALERRVAAQGFLRAHRSALVRLGAVRELTWTASDELVAVLETGARIPISRRRRAAFVAGVRRNGRP
jgi:two-component system, LytTR family, response regulator